MLPGLCKFVSVQYLHRYMQKSILNRLWRWDFCALESLSHGLRSKCTDLLNSYINFYKAFLSYYINLYLGVSRYTQIL